MNDQTIREYREALEPMKNSNRIAAMLISFMDKYAKDEGINLINDLDRVIDVLSWVEPVTKQKPTEFK